jgi:hypothetical protein
MRNVDLFKSIKLKNKYSLQETVAELHASGRLLPIEVVNAMYDSCGDGMNRFEFVAAVRNGMGLDVTDTVLLLGPGTAPNWDAKFIARTLCAPSKHTNYAPSEVSLGLQACFGTSPEETDAALRDALDMPPNTKLR